MGNTDDRRYLAYHCTRRNGYMFKIHPLGEFNDFPADSFVWIWEEDIISLSRSGNTSGLSFTYTVTIRNGETYEICEEEFRRLEKDLTE